MQKKKRKKKEKKQKQLQQNKNSKKRTSRIDVCSILRTILQEVTFAAFRFIACMWLHVETKHF